MDRCKHMDRDKYWDKNGSENFSCSVNSKCVLRSGLFWMETVVVICEHAVIEQKKTTQEVVLKLVWHVVQNLACLHFFSGGSVLCYEKWCANDHDITRNLQYFYIIQKASWEKTSAKENSHFLKLYTWEMKLRYSYNVILLYFSHLY